MIDRITQYKYIERYVNFVVDSLIICGFIFLLTPSQIWPDFYSPEIYGILALVSAGLIILPKYIFRTENECKREAALFMQFGIATAFLLNDLGSLYLYQDSFTWLQYDKILHLFSPFYLTVILVSFLQVWRSMNLKKASRLSIAIVIAGSFLWELLEYLSDHFFHTTAFGINGQYVFFDTFFDLLFDFVGVFIAAKAMSSKEFYKIVISEYCQNKLLNQTVKN